MRKLLPIFAAVTLCSLSLAGDAAGPSTQPVTIKLSDAKPLPELDSPDLQLNLTDKVTDNGTTIYFGEIDAFGDGDDQPPTSAAPVIATHDGGVWKEVPLSGPGLQQAGWRFVASGPSRREVWGVLDTAAGDSQPDFVLAHSTDRGHTFTLTPVHKPCKLATVSDFVLARNGRGRVTLSLDADFGQFKAGLYHYETVDHGKTWSAQPRFEPDSMIRADAVSDDEQPDPAEKPPVQKTTARGRTP